MRTTDTLTARATLVSVSERDPGVARGRDDGQEFLTRVVIGYELGSRLGQALHATAKDYHTSGAWCALANAALGARALGLDTEQTRHAVGIAEVSRTAQPDDAGRSTTRPC